MRKQFIRGVAVGIVPKRDAEREILTHHVLDE